MEDAYQQLGLEAALFRRWDYAEACKELAAILREVYAIAPKPLQTAIFQDVLTAFSRLPLLEMSQHVAAAHLLMQAAAAILPRQRKAQALGSYKHAVVAQRRQHKYKDLEKGLFRLPGDVLVHIFSFLDVKSLVNASVVCRSWNIAAREEKLWQEQCLFHFGIGNPYIVSKSATPSSSKNSSPVSWRQLFAKNSRKGNRIFVSNRAYCVPCKSILWMEEQGDGVVHVHVNQNHKLKPISPLQVSHSLVEEIQASSSSSSSGSESDTHTFGDFSNKFSRLWAFPKLSIDAADS